MAQPNVPAYLESQSSLIQFLESQFEGLSSHERGKRFARLVERLVPLGPFGSRFGPLTMRQHSHDDGVDLVSDTNEDDEKLCVQSKFKIGSKAEIDTIISHFQHFERLEGADSGVAEIPLWSDESPRFVYAIATASPLEGPLRAYRNSSLASRSFFEQLEAEDRLIRIDGQDLLQQLRRHYQRTYSSPDQVRLRAIAGWMTDGNVHVGFLRGDDLAAMYHDYGDGIFFENVRDFLGLPSSGSEDTVNGRIYETVVTAPERMVERNNGITIRGSNATRDDQDENVLVIDGAGIVNGCQTTMCIVRGGDRASEAHVLTKVVVSDDAWDVARAANHQNEVSLRDLELARFLRPQLLRKAAADVGVSIDVAHATKDVNADDIAAFLDEVVAEHLNYEDVKYLFLGLFCRRPNQLFQDNYKRLRIEALDALLDLDGNETERLFETLFLLSRYGRRSMEEAGKTFTEASERLLARLHTRSKYLAYTTLLASAGCLDQSIGEPASDDPSHPVAFLKAIREVVDNDPVRFEESFLDAYETMADMALDAWEEGDSEDKVLQRMSSLFDGSNFEALRQRVVMKRQRAERRGRA